MNAPATAASSPPQALLATIGWRDQPKARWQDPMQQEKALQDMPSIPFCPRAAESRTMRFRVAQHNSETMMGLLCRPMPLTEGDR